MRVDAKSSFFADEFSQQLLPLTQTVETLFQTFLPEEHSKYTAVYESIYDGNADNVDETFGISTSRSLVINVNTITIRIERTNAMGSVR